LVLRAWVDWTCRASTSFLFTEWNWGDP
jgi:hypothetical protein